jgi:hypothetical protein
MMFLRTILRFIISKEGKLSDPKKVEWLLGNPHDIQVFNGLAQFYQCFVNFFAFIMALITKFMQKLEGLIWTYECQKAWETIKCKYAEVPN